MGFGNPYASLFRIRLLSILISRSDFIFFQNNYEKLCRIYQSNKQPKILSYLSQVLRSTKFTLQSYFIAVATWGVSPNLSIMICSIGLAVDFAFSLTQLFEEDFNKMCQYINNSGHFFKSCVDQFLGGWFVVSLLVNLISGFYRGRVAYSLLKVTLVPVCCFLIF